MANIQHHYCGVVQWQQVTSISPLWWPYHPFTVNYLFLFDTGSIMGDSYFVMPSACHEVEAASDDIDLSELNAQGEWKAALWVFNCSMNA